jgi:hypothetical protein
MPELTFLVFSGFGAAKLNILLVRLSNRRHECGDVMTHLCAKKPLPIHQYFPKGL